MHSLSYVLAVTKTYVDTDAAPAFLVESHPPTQFTPNNGNDFETRSNFDDGMDVDSGAEYLGPCYIATC